jgi:hypothetical protein
MSKRRIRYKLADGTATDGQNFRVKVEIVTRLDGEILSGPYVRVDGVLCQATDVELYSGLLLFSAEPMSQDDYATLWEYFHEIEMERAVCKMHIAEIEDISSVLISRSSKFAYVQGTDWSGCIETFGVILDGELFEVLSVGVEEDCVRFKVRSKRLAQHTSNEKT